MRFSSRNSSLLILAITAISCSRVMFAFFQDPEGPNLLVVIGMASVIYLVSAAIYLSRFFSSLAGAGRSLATIFIQIFLTTGFYLGLR